MIREFTCHKCNFDWEENKTDYSTAQKCPKCKKSDFVWITNSLQIKIPMVHLKVEND